MSEQQITARGELFKRVTKACALHIRCPEFGNPADSVTGHTAAQRHGIAIGTIFARERETQLLSHVAWIEKVSSNDPLNHLSLGY
jgi:hypothetical protein